MYRSALRVTGYSGMPNIEGNRNATEEVAARMPAVKTKEPEDFVETKFLKEIDKEGFFKQFQKKI
jgi:hypothetical protein